MDIHIINNNHSAPIPSLDIYSYVDIPIKPMETVVIDTGIYLDLPSNIEAAIRNIIGYTTTKTLIVEQKIIDSSYKEEVCVIVCNAGEEIQYISEGDKIAQLVFKEVK
jgi:dUTP pyrophosphatase